MSNNALYVYGIVKSEIDLNWQEKGIAGKKVYSIHEGNFNALVHDCDSKAYSSENPEEIKEMILSHNKILDKAIEDFFGVLPLSFNTIIKEETDSAYVNLKKWLYDNQEKLERIWNKIKGKKEYGLRIYFEKKKLLHEASGHNEVKQIETNSKGKGPGLNYLLQGKAKAKTQEIFQESVNKQKLEFVDGIREITPYVVNNPSRISLEEEKDLLISLSVLIEEKEVYTITEFLEKKAEDFPFQIAGPFAPYSFVGTGE